MDNKNFLLVISKFPPEYSGPGVRIPRLYNWLREKYKNTSIQVLCNGIEQLKNEEYIYQDFSVRRVTAENLNKLFLPLAFIPKRLSHAIIYQYEFVKTLLILFFSKRYKNIDFLHVAGHSGGTAAALLWAKIRKIPVLMELVTEHARHIQKGFLLSEISVPENSVVIALTEKASLSCQSLGLSKDKIWCRPNPIDDQKFKIEEGIKNDLRETLTPFSHDQIVISNVAKIMPQKNQFLILQALTYLPKKFVAVIAGPFIKEGPLYQRDKEYLDKMRSYIQENDLQSRVCLLTDFVDAEKYMKLSDIYAMPAYNEGFGTPMMEAMGCGLPVVGNKGETAFQEWIIDGVNGYLCDIESPQSWAQAIEKASKFSKAQCLDISENIRKKAGQEAIYGEYMAIITKLLQGGK